MNTKVMPVPFPNQHHSWTMQAQRSYAGPRGIRPPRRVSREQFNHTLTRRYRCTVRQQHQRPSRGGTMMLLDRPVGSTQQYRAMPSSTHGQRYQAGSDTKQAAAPNNQQHQTTSDTKQPTTPSSQQHRRRPLLSSRQPSCQPQSEPCPSE